MLSAYNIQRARFEQIRAAAAHSKGAQRSGSDKGTLRASAATRAGATERRAAPTLGRRARRPGVQRTKWDKPIEATTMGYLRHTVLHTVARLARTTHQ